MHCGNLSRRLIGGAVAATITAFAAPAAQAAILTYGCANTNVSCTLEELTSGGYFFVNEVLFDNFDALGGPGASGITITPTKTSGIANAGGFTFSYMAVGFDLGFSPTLSVAEKGRIVNFFLDYTVNASAGPVRGARAELNMGRMHGAGDTVRAGLSVGSLPGPDINVSCLGVGACEDPADPLHPQDPHGFSDFGSDYKLLEVSNYLALGIDADTGGNDPYAEIRGFKNSFFDIPEPGTLMLSLLALSAVARTVRSKQRRC